MGTLITKPFSALLNATLQADSGYLPLAPADMNRLLTLIPEGDFMLLILDDAIHQEYVKVTNQCGTLLMERGLYDTEAVNFPLGSCVTMDVTPALVKWLICNYDCCDSAPCECTPVEGVGRALGQATVGRPWEGMFIFSGTLPIEVALSSDSSVPGWMTVSYGPNYVKLSGTPTGPGTFHVSAVATNCSGTGLDSLTGAVEVVSA